MKVNSLTIQKLNVTKETSVLCEEDTVVTASHSPLFFLLRSKADRESHCNRVAAMAFKDPKDTNVKTFCSDGNVL